MKEFKPSRKSLRIVFPVAMAFMLLPLAALAIGAYISLLQVSGELDDLAQEVSREIVPGQEMKARFGAAQAALAGYVSGATDKRNKYLEIRGKTDQEFAAIFANPPDLPEEVLLQKDAQSEWREASEAAEAILAIADPSKNPDAFQNLKLFETHIAHAAQKLSALQEMSLQQVDEHLQSSAATQARLRILIAVIFIIGTLLALATGIGLARSILQPLQVLAAGAARLGAGDLSCRVELNRNNELGQVAAAFNEMGAQLAEHQESLRKSEDRYRDIVENSPDLICTHDLDGRILTISGGVVRTMGYTPQDLMGHNIAEFVSPDSSQQFVDYLAHLKRDSRASGQLNVLSASGELVVLEYNMSIRRERVHTPIVRGMARDVTSRIRAEAQIFLQAAALESAANAIVIADRDGHITWVNPSFTRLTGFTPEEAIGQNPRILKSGVHNEAFYQQMWQTLMAGSNWRGEIINKRKDGTLYNEEMSITPVFSDGKIRHFVAIKQDVSERIRTQEELAAAREAAEGANRAKSDFLARMSHEIRTPMNGVIGMTELALDTELNPEQREYMETVKKSADTLLAVINDILDFSKIEAGKLELESIPFRLRDTLDDMVATLALRAQKKGLELACDVAADVPDDLVGDPGRLRQILLNLVGNSIKFTRTGEVIVRVTLQSASKAAASLRFSVRDTGVGIPPEKLEAIFKPFEQADGTITRRYGGTGLGLAIASQLAELMGGTLGVDSTLGAGTTFEFTADFKFGELATAPKPVNLRGLPALVVDDNETNRRILEKVLGSWGMDVTLADGGPASLAAMQWAANARRPFRIALVDSQMPVMDGFTLIGRLRVNPVSSSLPVIMMTSAGQPGDSVRCKQLGVAAFLTKPVRQSQLLESILAALGMAGIEVTSQPLFTSNTPGAPKRSLSVLLAEDNLVNQMVAQRVLQKWRHSVHTVNSGKEALEALETRVFDIVLMDVEMPEMDGLQATAAVRLREQTTGRHIPIVAMTAHAMKGDRERCLAAGMDGYVSKPVRTGELYDLLESLTSRGAPDSDATPAPELRAAASVFDRDRALAYLSGSEQLLGEIAAVFLEHTPHVLQDIHTAVANRDTKLLERAAHTLKGSASVFGAGATAAAAQQLEDLGRTGNLENAEAISATLEAEVVQLCAALSALVPAESQPGAASVGRN